MLRCSRLTSVFLNLFSHAAPLDVKIGLKSSELELLAAPLALSHGTLACRGTPVENHCLTFINGGGNLNKLDDDDKSKNKTSIGMKTF